MVIEDIEKKILKILENNTLTTEEIESKVKTEVDECSDKIVFALLRLKNKNKVKNVFDGKKNKWSLI